MKNLHVENIKNKESEKIALENELAELKKQLSTVQDNLNIQLEKNEDLRDEKIKLEITLNNIHSHYNAIIFEKDKIINELTINTKVSTKEI